MQIYAPGEGRRESPETGSYSSKARNPSLGAKDLRGQQSGKGLVWFNSGALLTGGTLGPGCTGSQNGEPLSPQHKGGIEGPKGWLCSSLCYLCQFTVTGKWFIHI